MDPQGISAPPVALPLAVPGANLRRRLGVIVPRLSVVVVNYLHWHDTGELIRQLRASPCLKHGTAEVVVVDNNSPSHPLISRLRRQSGVSLRRWRHNRGFARAVNEGCRLSRGDWILLLNPDITLSPSFLEQTLALADRLLLEEPHLGIVGFRLLNADGSRQHSTGPFPTLMGTLGRLLLPRSRRKYDLVPDGRRSPVDWATGCCLLVRRACWEELGGFDDRFFLYYEDVDLCRRARAAGWSVAFEPALSAVHHHPLHGRDVPPHLRVITRHALLTYARKHWPGWKFQVLARIVRLEAWCRHWAACWRRQPATAELFADLNRIAADLSQGQSQRAGRRLQRLVRRQEESRVAAALHRHPQP